MMTTIASAVALIAMLAATAPAVTPSARAPEKPGGVAAGPPCEDRVEGDTIEECWTIAALPFNDANTTCGFSDDYDEVCPYAGSTSPDVVYAYEPPADMCVSIRLCDSYYDTKFFVYEDELTPGSPYVCNDDNFDCIDPPVSYTSWIDEVALSAGHTYYIVVDGYGGDCGDYVLEMTEVDCTPPCDVVCDGLPESEPTCYDGYEDHHNGGCNSSPHVFQHLPAGDVVVVCGESGVYDFSGVTYRDTDWYWINPWYAQTISITVEAEFGALFGFVEGIYDCVAPAFISYYATPECTPHTITEELPYGYYAIFVSTDSWDPAYECGSEYSLTVEGYSGWSPVETASWGRVKALYR